jgi:hypothetical protein
VESTKRERFPTVSMQRFTSASISSLLPLEDHDVTLPIATTLLDDGHVKRVGRRIHGVATLSRGCAYPTCPETVQLPSSCAL